MKFAWIAVASWAPAITHAAPGAAPAPMPAATRDQAAPVIGGSDVPDGKWRDCAAVLFDNQQGCTGVLIAPNAVLTAGHCVDPTLNAVLLGANSLAHPSDGETIDVMRSVAHPGAYDLALLILKQPSTMPVRKLATGWAQSAIVDGAHVELVGFGAIDAMATNFVNEMQEAESTVTDAGCVRSSGCEPTARPSGEIGAGGAGVDTCPGDSGGPMYLLTDQGAFLAGITSRGYDSNTVDCSEGGIYTRPDKADIVAWIEREAGVALEDGLAPIGQPMIIAFATDASQVIDANDPVATGHRWEIVTQPATGTAVIDGDGRLTVTAGDTAATTRVVIRAIDANAPTRSAKVAIALTYNETGADAGGCCSTSGSDLDGGLVLGLAVAAGLRRRRRHQ